MDTVNNGLYRDLFNQDIVKCMRTRRKFKVDFPENKASKHKNLLHFFSIIQFRLHHQYRIMTKDATMN